MNNFIKTIFFVFAIFVSNRANANCANASLALNSITETSPGSGSWVVALTFCADHGALLTTTQTGNFEFTFAGSSAVTAFPPSIASLAAGLPVYAGSTATNKVTYIDAINWFHYLEAGVGANYCYPVSFTVTGRPTNITLYGIEAADDLTGGSGCPLSVTVPALSCSSTAAFGSAVAPTTPAPITITTCAFAGEYSTITGLVAGSTYSFSATGGAGNFITIKTGSADVGGVVVASGLSPVSVTGVTGTVFMLYNTDAACGTESVCHTGVVTCTSCTAACSSTAAFGSAVAPTAPAPVTITSCAYAGEYSTITGLVAGSTYSFSATGGTGNFITIKTGSADAGGVVVASGLSPVSVTGVTGTVFMLYNTSAACGTESVCHTGVVTCTSCTVSPPPANDDCVGAVGIILGVGSCTSPAVTDNTNATDSGIGDPGCAFYGGGDVWHSVVVPCSGNITVETSAVGGSPVTDTGLALYSGSCGALTLIECDDDDSPAGFFSLIALTGRTPGETIYIRTWEYGNASFGQYNVCAYDLNLAPANDECATATPLTVGAGSCAAPVNGTNAGATDSGIAWPASCNGDALSYSGGDVWYSIVVPTGCNNLVIETSDDGTGSIDTQIAVWDACNGTLIDCSDDAIGLFSQVVIPASNLTPGSTIYVGVSEYSNNECGTFNICAYTQAPPPCPVIDFTPDVTSVCHGGDVTFTAGGLCSLSTLDLDGDGFTPDQVADLYVYIDPATGEPGTAPSPLTIVAGTQLSQMATLHPDWLGLEFDGTCASGLVGNLINTGCATVTATLAIVTYNYALDADCDGDASEYDGCAMQQFSVDIYPDPTNFTVVTAPGSCGTAATATLQLLDNTVCATQTGTVPATPTCGVTNSAPLNYSFSPWGTCVAALTGTVAANCTGVTQPAGIACNDGNPATTNDVIQADGCTCLGTTPTATVTNDNPSITDPCTCNNNATSLTNGTFNEQVLVTATTGLMIRIAVATGTNLTLPSMMVESPAGSYSSVMFSHVDNVGYSISLIEYSADGGANWFTLNTGGGVPLAVSNKCAYPDPVITVTPAGPFCTTDAPANLTASLSNASPVGTASFSGTGVSGTTFTPATAGAGTHTITLDYTGGIDANAGVSPDGGTTPAYPGCVQRLSTTASVSNCGTPCNANNGTPSFNP